MKQLYDGFDPVRIVGRELETVLYASNLVSLQFGQDVLVTILAEVVFKGGDEGISCRDAAPWHSTSLLTLIGRQVEAACIGPTGSLILEFENGSTLEISRDQSGYESYVVSIAGEEWVG